VVTIAQIEAIFRRQGWPYRNQDGRLVTSFDNIPMVVGAARDGQSALVLALVYHTTGAEVRTFQAHHGEIDAFLDYVVAHLSITGDATYQIGLDEDSVYVVGAVPLSGNAQDDRALRGCIGVVGLLVGALRPPVVALAQGRTTVQQAISDLNRALADQARRQGPQSA
jgi:hypothetical protein